MGLPLVVSVELPASGRIVRREMRMPRFVGMTIDLDVTMMLDDAGTSSGRATAFRPPTRWPPCSWVEVDEPLADCVVRLIRMSEMPKANSILYPSVMHARSAAGF